MRFTGLTAGLVGALDVWSGRGGHRWARGFDVWRAGGAGPPFDEDADDEEEGGGDEQRRHSRPQAAQVTDHECLPAEQARRARPDKAPRDLQSSEASRCGARRRGGARCPFVESRAKWRGRRAAREGVRTEVARADVGCPIRRVSTRTTVLTTATRNRTAISAR